MNNNTKTIDDLKQELTQLKQERNKLQKLFKPNQFPIHARYQFIEDHRELFKVKIMCNVLSVSRSGYYGWRGRTSSK